MRDDLISRESLRRRMYREAKRYVDVIEAEAAIKDLFADMPRIEFNGNRRRWREENEQYLRCLDVLRSLPTADVRENVHARWKVRSRTDKWEYCECQNCGECYDFDIGERFRYCPNCGAEMEE